MKKEQFNDDEVGGGGNMTFKSTSQSPKHGTSIRAVAWRDDSNNSTSDNNGYHERITIADMKRNG